jgi:hypothetical protein
MVDESGFDSPQDEREIFLLSTTFRLTPRPTQHLI